MTTIQISNKVKEVKNSSQDTFTVELKGSINIHEAKDIDFVIQRYISKGKNIQSLKTGSHYGF